MKQLVIMPGGFHPFHAGHLKLYQWAVDNFPGADVKVAATNDTSNRPFPFRLKEKLAQLAGVPPGDFYQVRSPFRADEITQNYDPNDTQLIFVRSEKDSDQPPRPGGVKKDGTPAYLQPISDVMAPMNQHAYMVYGPTVDFGPGMRSATQIRTAWPDLNPRQRLALVMSLYPHAKLNPQLAKTVVNMLDTVLGTDVKEQDIKEGLAANIDWVKPNFDFEWHEIEQQSKMNQVPIDVRQYYHKYFPDKHAWLKAVQNGQVRVVQPNHNYEIRNAPFDKASLQKVLAPSGHEGSLGPEKEKRVNALFDRGETIEMPIILKTNKGLWLIGGKTRLGTANYIKGIPAKVWLIGGQQDVDEEVTRQMSQGGLRASYQNKYNQPMMEDYLDEARS